MYILIVEKCDNLETENATLKKQINDLNNEFALQLNSQRNELLTNINECERQWKNEVEKLKSDLANAHSLFRNKG